MESTPLQAPYTCISVIWVTANVDVHIARSHRKREHQRDHKHLIITSMWSSSSERYSHQLVCLNVAHLDEYTCRTCGFWASLMNDSVASHNVFSIATGGVGAALLPRRRLMSVDSHLQSLQCNEKTSWLESVAFMKVNNRT